MELFTLPSMEQWVWLGISGIIGLSIGDYFAFSAFKILGSSRTSLFSIFAPGAALIFGYFMLDENINAIGLTGADLDLVRAAKRPVGEVDYGFVGDVKQVNYQALNELLISGAVPVIAPITHDGHGQLLNTNADTIASELAVAMCFDYDVRLIFCFEKSGVLMNETDEHTKINEINPELFKQLKDDGIVSDGMIPKLTDGFAALHRGVGVVVITNPAGISEGLRGTRLVLE